MKKNEKYTKYAVVVSDQAYFYYGGKSLNCVQDFWLIGDMDQVLNQIHGEDLKKYAKTSSGLPIAEEDNENNTWTFWLPIYSEELKPELNKKMIRLFFHFICEDNPYHKFNFISYHYGALEKVVGKKWTKRMYKKLKAEYDDWREY